MLAALDLRPPRTVPFVDERGRRIGDAVVDGCQIVARITDEGAAAELRASVGPRGVSVGYRVKVEPEPEPEPATPAAAVTAPARCNECGAALPLSPGRLGCAECYGDGPPFEARPAESATLAQPDPTPTTHGTAIPPDGLVSEMLPCPFCGKRVLLGVEMAPVSGCPAVWCRACGAWGPPGRGNAEDSGEAIANWNRRKLEPAAARAEAGHLDPSGRWQPGDPASAGSAVHSAAEIARHEAIRKVAADAKLGDAWAERMIDAGTTVEQARHVCRLGRGRG